MSIKIKYLGIDFGSSSVSVVGYEQADGKPIIFFHPHYRDEKVFATAMAKDKSAYFQTAYELDENRKAREIVNSLKEDITRGTNKDYVQAYMVKLFETIKGCKRKGTPYDFSELERIGFGYPTYVSEQEHDRYCNKLRGIIREACEKVFEKPNIPIVCNPEPILAAIAYNEANKSNQDYLDKVNNGDLVLVLDLGGYTIDMAIVQIDRQENIIRRISDPKSVKSNKTCVAMGKQITNNIYQQVVKAIYNGTEEDEDRFNPQIYKAIEDAKIQYFTEGKGRCESWLPVTIDSNDNSIEKLVLEKDVSRSDPIDKEKKSVYVGIESSSELADCSINIKDSYLGCIVCIELYLQENSRKLRGKKISHILFTGGTAKIEDLRETIKNQIEREYVKEDVISWWVDEWVANDDFKGVESYGDANVHVPLSSANIVALGAAISAVRNDNSGTISVGRSQNAKDLETRNFNLNRKIRDIKCHINNQKEKNACAECEECCKEIEKLLQKRG